MTDELNILGNAKFPTLNFGERFVSDFFRKFVNSLPCSYPNCKNKPIDAHHPVHKSAGNSAGDEITIPLCRIHHSKWTSIEKFEAETGLKIGDVIRFVWQRFIRHVEMLLLIQNAEPRKSKVPQKKKDTPSGYKPLKSGMCRCLSCGTKFRASEIKAHVEECAATENTV